MLPPRRHPITTLDDVLCRFAPLDESVEPPSHIRVRGGALAVAMDWLGHLPACAARDEALELLAEAAKVACAAADLA